MSTSIVHRYGKGKIKIVMPQGWSLPPFLWSKALKFFDLNKFDIIIIDIGKIDLEENCDLNSFCNMINDIATHNNFYPDFLFGHSMGATIMINLLLNFSVKLKGIVFIDSGLKPAQRSIELMSLINKNATNIDTYRKILRSFFRNIGLNDLEKFTDEFMRYNIDILKCQLKAISDYDFTTTADLLTLPVLIIFGKCMIEIEVLKMLKTLISDLKIPILLFSKIQYIVQCLKNRIDLLILSKNL